MSKYNEILALGLDTIIDMKIDPIIAEDDVYTQSMVKADEKFRMLDLTESQKELLDDYVASVMCANQRACNIAFLVGAKSGMEFLAT